jgi:predicted RNA binding protein YcfA (HicA-like mRNA interferase family)
MKSSELIRILKKDGWIVMRQKGSHMIMQHPNKPKQLTVPNHGSQEVGTGLASKILKDAGLK